jgi:hypothetical protein
MNSVAAALAARLRAMPPAGAPHRDVGCPAVLLPPSGTLVVLATSDART